MRKKRSNDKKTAVTIILFAIIMTLFLFSVHFTAKGNIDRQKQSLMEAIQRDVTYCYATTGRYPKTLDYIERVYGLTYDRELFEVDYKIVGSKIPPEITVINKETGK